MNNLSCDKVKDAHTGHTQYILSHFINTEDESIINEKYIESLNKLKNDFIDFDLSNYLKAFNDKIIHSKQKNQTDYHSVIKEIARLKRYELSEFKSRFLKVIEESKLNELKLPYRFISPTTNCGFVFSSITSEYSQHWENAIRNMNESFKYKWKLEKSLGVIVYKKGSYFEINWAYNNYEWKFDKELEEMVEKEKAFINSPERKPLLRYKFEK